VLALVERGESYFAILKRCVHGIHRHWSKKHLERYLAERAFVWTNRRVTDGERAFMAVHGNGNRKLTHPINEN